MDSLYKQVYNKGIGEVINENIGINHGFQCSNIQ